jgi:hypothetical protein
MERCPHKVRYSRIERLAVIQNLLPLLPRRIDLPLAIEIVAGGAAVWLAGARFSRTLLALAATLAGGAIGYQSPQWFGWNVDPWSVAVGGALMLGIIGFIGHRWIAALGLGVVLSVWTVLATIACVGLHGIPDFAELLPRNAIAANLNSSPQGASETNGPIIFAALAVGLIAGITFAVAYRRLALVLFWSLLGSAAAILPALAVARPHYLTWVPRSALEQGLFLFVMVALGAAVQWRITFSKASASAVHSSPKPSKSDQ